MKDLSKNPIVLCLVAGIIGAILSYIDHKYTSGEDFQPNFMHYTKILILISGLSYGVLTFSCQGCPLGVQTGGGEKNAPWSESSSVDKIHTGNPNF